jgi:LysM repeat protein
VDGPTRNINFHEVKVMTNHGTIQKTLYIAMSALVIVALMAVALPRSALASNCQEMYTVEPGDLIGRIAKEYDTTINKIARANDLTPPYVLEPGQVLCIPKVPAKSSDYTWSASNDGKTVLIAGEKFKKTYPFIVKARADDSTTWYRLGRVGTDKNGDLEKKFTLPNALAKEIFLTVCLKDGVNNYLDCKRVVKQ